MEQKSKLIDLSLALLAKSKGFDYNVTNFFIVNKTDNSVLGTFDNISFNYNDDFKVLSFLPIFNSDTTVSRPDVYQLQDWVREKDISVEVVSHKYTIRQLKSMPRVYRFKINEDFFEKRYNDYQEALIDGLTEALKNYIK
jgi:hypothetical protein